MRKQGYYWVKLNGVWDIAYQPSTLTVDGKNVAMLCFDMEYIDSEFDEIDSKMIERK